MDKVRVILGREWREVFKDKLILITALVLPLLFIAMTVGTLYIMDRQVLQHPTEATEIGEGLRLERLMEAPAYANLDPVAVVQVLILEQYLLYWLIIPLMIPIFVAVYGIIGEKQQQTLEPLLATPIRVWELLLGKILAAVIPAIVITWVSYLMNWVALSVVVRPEIYHIVGTPKWLIAMGILVPLLTLMSVSIGMIISSRVNDVRLAEQLGGLLVLPVVGLTIPVLMGRLLLSAELFAAGAALIAMIDGGLLYLSVQLFQRETILIRWK